MYFSDLIVGETTCDGKKKMYELLGEIKNTHVMQLPHFKNEYSLALWKNEIAELIKRLEKEFDIKITEEKLKESIKLFNEERRVIKELYELGKLNPSPIKGSEMHEALHSSNYKFDRLAYINEIKELIKNLKEMHSQNNQKEYNQNTPRILITGCPTGGLVDKVIKQIEEVGASVVCFDSCLGSKNFEILVDENKDPIEAIAEKYLDIPCSVMSPNDDRMDIIKRYIEEYNVDGVVEVTLTSCHTYAIETEKVRRTVESMGKSYLNIETNYSNSDAPQLRTRLEAFVEML